MASENLPGAEGDGPPDWRTPVLVTTARFLPAIAAVPVGLGLFAHAKTLLPFLPLAAALLGASAWVALSRSLSAQARVWILAAPMVAIGAHFAYRFGPGSSAGLTLATVTVMVGLVRGGRAGVVVLALTAACLAAFGVAGRAAPEAYLSAQLPLPETWLRAIATYVVTTGVLLAFVAHAVGRVEDAEAEARAHERSIKHAYVQLGQLTRRLEAAKEDERRHIARELHDELGQALTAVKLNLQLLAQGRGTAADRLRESTEMVDRSIQAVRELSRGMRPPLLDEIGLVPALQAFLDEQARRSGIAFELKAPPADGRGPPEIEIAAFRIVQEAVTNVVRHAEARRVSVRVGRSDRALDIAVRDDGRGFDVDGALARGGHLGLVGMRERASALGGTFALRSAAGEGTEVRVRLPAGGAA